LRRRNDMTERQIVRAWKDEDYRRSLTEAELSALPENPAGIVELDERSQGEVDGGSLTDALIAIVTGVAPIIYTNIASCYHCGDSILGGGSCAYGTSGCC
jgi:mersacidin/lichenicidin family type 2 lantibiotic